MKRRLVIFAVSLLCLSLLGCAQNITRSSSSMPLGRVMEPAADSRRTAEKAPLALPLSVAIIAVPGQGGRYVPNTTLRMAAEKLKEQLLAYPKYVGSVAIVEKDDLSGKISLDRIAKAYAADVAVVLSYQQDQRTSQSGLAGLLDATIIGIYTVPGVEVKTASIIDGKVIHIPNNAIIFRAAGKDQRSRRSTTYAHEGALTEESIAGIQAATADFGTALTAKLDRFEKYDLSRAVPLASLTGNGSVGKEDNGNDYWKEVNTFKTSGGGAFGLAPLLISAAICCAAWRRR